MSKSLSRAALELRRPAIAPRLPPTYLLPVRARWISSPTTTTTSSTTTTLDAPELSSTGPVLTTFPTKQPSSSSSPLQNHHTPTSNIHDDHISTAAATTLARAALLSPTLLKNKPPQREAPREPSRPIPTDPIPQSIKDLLPLLRAQPGGQYITFHIHGRPYLVTVGDLVRLPFHMPGVQPGDVLRLNRVSVLGSRDFTIKPGGGKNPTTETTQGGLSNQPAYIDERLYELRAVVHGVEAEPMREMEKTKRRNRKVKTVKTKLRYTVLRISELKIARPEDLP